LTKHNEGLSMVGRGWSIRLGLRVSSDSLIGDLSNISVVVI